MSLSIVLSGPKSCASQVRTSLAASGFSVAAHDADWGLPEHPVEGERFEEPHAFVTVEGTDVDAAHAAVVPLGWRLRMHFETPEPSPPSEADLLRAELAALRADIAALKGVVHGR